MQTLRKLWSILSPAQRRSIVALVGLILANTALETLGVGLVLPVLSVLTGAHESIMGPQAARWLELPEGTSRGAMLVGGMVFLLLLFSVKAASVLLLSWWQSKFTRRIQREISVRLYDTYMKQPWQFHLQRNSHELMANVRNLERMASACMVILNAFTDLFILAGICALLLWVNPVATAVVGVVAACSLWLLNRLTRRRMTNWSKTQQRYLVLLTKSIQEGFGGVKDAKILGCEDVFVDRFSTNASMMAAMTERQLFMGNVPRLWYELLAVMAICTLTAVLVWQRTPTESIIPTLGVFAVAAFRLLPSVTRLAMASQAMHTIAPLVDTTVRELELTLPRPDAATEAPLPFGHAVELRDVAYAYATGGRPALDGVDIRIPCGASVGIIGPSGAGKSTLVDVLLGLLAPTRGQVLVDGVDIGTNPRRWQALVGYVPQSIFLSDDTIRANVAFGVPPEKVDDEAVWRALRGARLDGFVADLPAGVRTMVGERGVRLSGGQRQRIGIARALYHDPQVLVLDEATSALDTDTERGVMQAVEALHGVKTLVIVAHRLSTVANCDTLYRLEHGRVTDAGTYAQVCPTPAS